MKREPIKKGLDEWRAAYDRGEKLPPVVLRINGSGIAPDTWNTLQQEQLTELFDPVTLFDLCYYYSELQGWGPKYIRYVTVVENDVLPKVKEGPSVFYAADGSILKPEYAASMDRLGEIAEEGEILWQWAGCLIYRIEAKARSMRSADGTTISQTACQKRKTETHAPAPRHQPCDGPKPDR